MNNRQVERLSLGERNQGRQLVPAVHFALKLLNNDNGHALLTPVETEVVNLFVHLVQALGAPKSLGAIYGLLFVSPRPVTFHEVLTRLQLSSGSVSQGLKVLKALGAVRVTFVPGDRRDHFLAESRLRHLAAGFLRESVSRHLSSGEERLERLADLVDRSSGESTRDFLTERLRTLQGWQAQSKNVIPALLGLLEG